MRHWLLEVSTSELDYFQRLPGWNWNLQTPSHTSSKTVCYFVDTSTPGMETLGIKIQAASWRLSEPQSWSRLYKYLYEIWIWYWKFTGYQKLNVQELQFSWWRQEEKIYENYLRRFFNTLLYFMRAWHLGGTRQIIPLHSNHCPNYHATV